MRLVLPDTFRATAHPCSRQSRLRALLEELLSTTPLFIRCIKPNGAKLPKQFDARLVLEQLRCSGVIGATTLLQEAYPTRVPYW